MYLCSKFGGSVGMAQLSPFADKYGMRSVRLFNDLKIAPQQWRGTSVTDATKICNICTPNSRRPAVENLTWILELSSSKVSLELTRRLQLLVCFQNNRES